MATNLVRRLCERGRGSCGVTRRGDGPAPVGGWSVGEPAVLQALGLLVKWVVVDVPCSETRARC